MTISITHAKTSSVTDGADTSLVQPSDWNDDHVVPEAGSGDFRSNAAGKVLSPAAVWTDATPVDLGNETGTVTLDFSSFINAKMTATGAITLGSTSNLKYGASGVIIIKQDGTGSRTLAINTTYWECDGGTVPVLSTTANAVDILIYYVRDNGKVSITLRKDSK